MPVGNVKEVMSARLRSIVVGSLAAICLVASLAGCNRPPPPPPGGGGGGNAPVARNTNSSPAPAPAAAAALDIDLKCSDFSNDKDQVVCLANSGGADVDVSSWQIRDGLGRSYQFPEGTRIAAGQNLKIHTGEGASAPGVVYWGYKFNPVFYSTDQIILSNANGDDQKKVQVP